MTTVSPNSNRNKQKKVNRWSFLKPQDPRVCGVKLIKLTHDETKVQQKQKKHLTHIRYAAKQVLFLSTFAEEENWGEKQRVLRSYLNSTFHRLVEEGKVLGYKSKLSTIAMIWNTGLLTASSTVEIYCLMIRNDVFTNKSSKKESADESVPDDVEWRIATFLSVEKFSEMKTFRHVINNWSTVDIKMTDLPASVPQATYFASNLDSYSKFIYDPQVVLKKDVLARQLLVYKDKLPEEFADIDDDKLVECVQNGIDISVKRAKYNYRLAVPQYLRDKNNYKQGTLQILFPIKIVCDSREFPEVAVSLQLEQANEENFYTIKNLIPLDVAYINARLLQKIDQGWLQLGLAPEAQQVPSESSYQAASEQPMNVYDMYPYMYPAPYYMPYYGQYQYAQPVYYPPQHE